MMKSGCVLNASPTASTPFAASPMTSRSFVSYIIRRGNHSEGGVAAGAFDARALSQECLFGRCSVGPGPGHTDACAQGGRRRRLRLPTVGEVLHAKDQSRARSSRVAAVGLGQA